MSPASYLTAPPRDAACSIAAHVSKSVSESRKPSPARGDGGARVEDEMVPVTMPESAPSHSSRRSSPSSLSSGRVRSSSCVLSVRGDAFVRSRGPRARPRRPSRRRSPQPKLTLPPWRRTPSALLLPRSTFGDRWPASGCFRRPREKSAPWSATSALRCRASDPRRRGRPRNELNTAARR